MEPQSPTARVRWLEHTLEGLADELTALGVQLRALVLQPPALDGPDQELADLLQRQLETMERQGTMLRAYLAAFRAELTGDPVPGTSTAASAETSARQRAEDEPNEPDDA